MSFSEISNFKNMEKDFFEKNELKLGEEKEGIALEDVLGEFLTRKKQEKEARLKDFPFFESKGRKFEIKNSIDRSIAGAQVEIEIMRGILEKIREEGDYFKEKAAAKLLEWLEKEISFLFCVAEMKTNYPNQAEFLKKEKPYLDYIFE